MIIFSSLRVLHTKSIKGTMHRGNEVGHCEKIIEQFLEYKRYCELVSFNSIQVLLSTFRFSTTIASCFELVILLRKIAKALAFTQVS